MTYARDITRQKMSHQSKNNKNNLSKSGRSHPAKQKLKANRQQTKRKNRKMKKSKLTLETVLLLLGCHFCLSAFIIPSTYTYDSNEAKQIEKRWKLFHSPKDEVSVETLNLKSNDEATILTNALLRVSFDGSRFTGWSAANTGDAKHKNDKLQRPSKRRRRRGAVGEIPPKAGFVRSVEGIIRDNLAKIYGNVDPNRIIVEGCSRTDKGVHAKGMIAQIYCLKSDVLDDLKSNESDKQILSSIPGKRKPHPKSPTDTTYFEPIPMGGNLSRLAFALNRMRPADVQVTGIAPTPILSESSDLPFHPSLSTHCKTYEYKISAGDFQDPTMRRLAWFVSTLDIEKIAKGCEILKGTHDFSAFQGAPRGREEKRKRLEQQSPSSKRSTFCTLFNIELMKKQPISEVYYPGINVCNYKFVITGDRFLYKMNRFIVGALVALGTGDLELDDLERAIKLGSRKEFTCAPAHGLTLKSVDYGDLSIDWQPLRY